MTLDTRLPILAAQGAQVNLADMYAKAQDMRMQREGMDMRREQFDYQRQQMEAQQQEAAAGKQREQAGLIAKLTTGVQDEGTYQQRLAAARAYGIDVSAAPPNYDPEWVQTQNIIASTFLKPDGQKELTTTAQELAEAGYEPGTPEFQKAMAQRIAMKDSKVVTTTAGGMAGMLGPGGYQPLVLPNDGSSLAGAPAGGKTVVRTGKDASGRQVVQYSDGSVEYAGGGAGNSVGGF